MSDSTPLEAYDQAGVVPVADFRRTRKPRGDRAETPMIDRLPPNSPEAEQGVLGCILLDPYECIYQCITEFKDGASVFYDLRHQVIYETMAAMADKLEPIEVMSVMQRLRDRSQLESVGGIAYLATLPDTVPSAANLGFYVNVVKQKHLLRKMIRAATDIVGKTYEWDGETDELVDTCEAEFLAATQRQENDMAQQCRPSVLRCIEQIEKFNQNQGILSGISFGFPDLDKMTTGMHGGEMIVIAARPSMGKTSLAMNIAESVAVNQKLPVGVFSLEMTEDQLILRTICSAARVNLRNVREGFLAERDFPKITSAAGRIAAAPIYIDDSSGISIMELRAKARRMWQMFGIKLFVVDYLQLLHSTNRKSHNRQQEIGDICHGLKALSKDLDVPVVVLAQLNRELEKDKNRKPRMSDLRESGDIEQDADLIGLLYKPGTDDDDDGREQEAVPVNLLIAKQRNGGTGDIRLTFLREYTRFESAARISANDVESPTQSTQGDFEV